MSKLIEGTYRVVDSRTGKPAGRAYKTLEAAKSMAVHKMHCHQRWFSVYLVVRAAKDGVVTTSVSS
jgi:hypothetical protein